MPFISGLTDFGATTFTGRSPIGDPIAWLRIELRDIFNGLASVTLLFSKGVQWVIRKPCVVFRHMIQGRSKLKVIGVIVEFISVFVVNKFPRHQYSSDHAFHNHPMEFHGVSSKPDSEVAFRIDVNASSTVRPFLEGEWAPVPLPAPIMLLAELALFRLLYAVSNYAFHVVTVPNSGWKVKRSVA